MTKLTKPVRRASDAIVRSGGKLRNIVVTIYPNDTIGFRLSKTRKEEILPIGSAFQLAIRARLANEKHQKAIEKKEKLKAKERGF